MKKTTIYIDVDDDIAAIIDKLTNAEQKIVALVLPKRPSVLQGSVNMQLLKKSAEDDAKSLVLITNDDQVIRLAGQSAMHVSGSLQSKPYIPELLSSDDSAIEEVSDTVSTSDSSKASATPDPAQPDVYAGDEKVDLATPIGQLAGVDDDEEIELDNSTDIPEEDAIAEETKKSSASKIKVPNFGKFRTRVGAGLGALLLLVGGIFWAIVIAPKASITISTSKTDSQAKIAITASKATIAVDAEKGLVPAVQKEDKQKLTGTFPATGQKDVGEKASGTMKVRNCDYSDGFTLPSGTKFSNSGKVFVSTEPVVVPKFTGSSFSCTLSGNQAGTATVDVVAEQSGDTYNVSSRGYTISSIPSEAEVDAVGSVMGGGTTKLVKVVTNEDIDSATAKILATAADNVKGKLSKLLKDDGLLPVEDTFVSAQGAPTSSIGAGAEAPSDPTITIEVTSSMLGMKLSDIEPLVQKEIEKKIDTAKQKIYSSGLSAAILAVTEKPAPDTVKLTITSTASIGPKLESSTVASEIAGKKAGDAKQTLEAIPGVSKVEIRLSPFWVFSIPKNTSKITVSVNE